MPFKYDIGWAMDQIKLGFFVTRMGWDVPGQIMGMQVPDQDSTNMSPYVWIIPSDHKRVPWIPTQADLLAEDWACMQIAEQPFDSKLNEEA